MNEIALGWTQSGTRHPESVVYLHGALLGSRMWHAQSGVPARKHRVFVDLPGVGRSAGLHWRSITEVADQVAEVIETVARGGRAHVVGFSLGGNVGVHLVHRHPRLVRSALLSGLTATPPSAEVVADAWRSVPMLRDRMLHESLAEASRLPKREREEFYAEAAELHTGDYEQVLRDIHEGLPLAGWASNEVPVLVVAGEQEPGPAHAAVDTLTAFVPRSHGLIVPGLGRCWNSEDPALFGDVLDGWIADRCAPLGLVAR